jgi:hypothetical protein
MLVTETESYFPSGTSCGRLQQIALLTQEAVCNLAVYLETWQIYPYMEAL